MDPIRPVHPPVPPLPVTSAPTGELERVAREFESVFLATMVEGMLKGSGSEMFGGGHAEEMWRSLLARAYADQLAATGQFGLAEAVAGTLGEAASAYKGR